MADAAALVTQLRGGGLRAVARALSVVEHGGREAEELLGALPAAVGDAHVVGVTGGFGAGKSTLLEMLGVSLRRRGEQVAVLAVDPSSPFSGGALLGDRVRMTQLVAAGGFVRSMATRGVLGGLAAAAGDAVRVLAAAGFARIFVETVGVGQDEVDVAGEVDTVVLLLPPGAGDEIQTAKAGLLEVADIFVVNKADQSGADGVVAALEAMLDSAPAGTARRPPVLRTVARTGEGIEALIDEIELHRQLLERSGERRELGRRRLQRQLERLLATLLVAELRERQPEAWGEAMERVGEGLLTPLAAARELLARGGGR